MRIIGCQENLKRQESYSIQENGKQQDSITGQGEIQYNQYSLNGKERILYFVKGSGIVVILTYLFYHTFWAIPFLTPILFAYFQERKISLNKKRLFDLNIQFKDAILAVSASLSAGYSIENAFKDARKEMTILYGADSIIVKELQCIEYKLNMNVTLEKAMENFAMRSGQEEILNFTQVLWTAKKSGGDFNKIIQRTAGIIHEKIEIKKEIKILVSAKQLEQKIMNGIPIAIILYINFSNPGFLNGMYGNITGVILMTVCLVIYMTAYYIARKIVDIEI